MSYETPSEYFKRSPGKTLADYYQHRKKIDSSLGEGKKLNIENFSRIIENLNLTQPLRFVNNIGQKQVSLMRKLVF
jgi:hypothetical protein